MIAKWTAEQTYHWTNEGTHKKRNFCDTNFFQSCLQCQHQFFKGKENYVEILGMNVDTKISQRKRNLSPSNGV